MADETMKDAAPQAGTTTAPESGAQAPETAPVAPEATPAAPTAPEAAQAPTAPVQDAPAPAAPAETAAPAEPVDEFAATDEDNHAEIAADLSERSQRQELPPDGEFAPQTAKAAPSGGLDLSMFSPEQIDALKEAIDRHQGGTRRAKNRRMFVDLRRGTEELVPEEFVGKLVVSYNKARRGVVFDEGEQRKVNRTLIDVVFEGAKEKVEMIYSDFMNLERVACEVIKTESEERTIDKGMVMSRELKVEVPMTVNFIERTFTVKKPNGETLKIAASMVN